VRVRVRVRARALATATHDSPVNTLYVNGSDDLIVLAAVPSTSPREYL
jgi:hypothetical protein